MEGTDTADRYLRFGRFEARGHSPTYERLCAAVADDAALLGLLDELPVAKRQPNLLYGAVRFLGGPLDDGFLPWVHEHWAEVSAVMRERSTQTNEPGRCATLLPLLTSLPQPLALIEVGASAGLCLYPDRYRYRYDGGQPLGPASGVTLACRTNGPVPREMPRVVWRAGIDLNPIDVRDVEQVRWLEALVWPEQEDRLSRLRAAVDLARSDPPHLVRGDVNETLDELVRQAPRDATVVVFHSAVLAYLPPAERERFAATMRRLPVRWISNEAPTVLPDIAARLGRTPPADRGVFVLALDEKPVAFTGPHGQFLDWL
ncbi:DUF2332 domain-containing protein [Microtetraspora sp. NBRC 16547]|uniref:DUF2332 domain-containing protein n=1 Tax=Microtetraspora sp. NBRC 16547 TaxID=3030993 RepID=UPI00255269EB|nr:DUF2332 domain-containing protein [Microtetraspora sp. NBRC 16547]